MIVVAVDATCCRIMGINPAKIDYLRIARGEDQLGEPAFRQTGERIASVKTFRLRSGPRRISWLGMIRA